MPNANVNSGKGKGRGRKPRNKPLQGRNAANRNAAIKRVRELGLGSDLTASERQYVNLILDPCNAELTNSVLPGSNGSFVSRIPFRIIYIPTKSYGFAQLLPWSLDSTTDPKMLTIYEADTQVTSFINGTATSQNIYSVDTVLAATIGAAADMVRPIAGCVRCTYIDTAQNCRGYLWGAEGDISAYMNQMTAAPLTNVWLPKAGMNAIELSGTGPIPMSEGVESKLNMLNGDGQFRSVIQGNNIVAAGVDSRSGTTNRWPACYVGWAGINPAQALLIDGVLVYEWVPQATYGLQAPREITVQKPGALDRVTNAIANLSDRLVVAYRSTIGNQSSWYSKALGFAGQYALNYATGGLSSQARLLLTN